MDLSGKGLSVIEQMKKITHMRARWAALKENANLGREEAERVARSFRQDGDEEAFLEAMKVFITVEDERFEMLLAEVSDQVYTLLAHYSDDGYGDKPPNVHRITYWFQHLDMGNIVAFRDAIKPRPPTDSIVRADRPASTAFKCGICKKKLQRGQLAHKTCHVDVSPWETAWREDRVKHTHLSCMGADEIAAARTWPLIDGVTESERTNALQGLQVQGVVE